jgi:excisionase family DNA binding protein
MTANELRQILADALDGAAERLRGGISDQPIAATAQPKRESSDPLPGITKPTLTVDEAAGLLGLSAWSVYASIRTGEFPALRVGRRLLVPTHALRSWMANPDGGS